MPMHDDTHHRHINFSLKIHLLSFEERIKKKNLQLYLASSISPLVFLISTPKRMGVFSVTAPLVNTSVDDAPDERMS